jgi:hypothetical protein
MATIVYAFTPGLNNRFRGSRPWRVHGGALALPLVGPRRLRAATELAHHGSGTRERDLNQGARVRVTPTKEQ